MYTINVEFNKGFPISLFQTQQIKDTIDTVFSKMNNDIILRFNDIMKFIEYHNTHIYNTIKFDIILHDFKMYFFNDIYYKANNTANKDINLIDVITSLITNENVKNALFGKPMIYAFAKYIYNIQTNDALTKYLYDSFVILLEKQFLENA